MVAETELTSTGLIETPGLPARTAIPAETQAGLERLVRLRMRKCLVLLPKILGADNANAVHDLRVWSRRSQQVVAMLHPKPAPAVRKILRGLRQMRRSLSVWRDCDVLIHLLEERLRRVRNPEEKIAWEMVRDRAVRKRERQMRRARRSLAKSTLFTPAQDGKRLEDQILRQIDYADTDPRARLASSIAGAYERWRANLSRAGSSGDPADIHAFRIQTKRLRYRIELARDLGDRNTSAPLACLKRLQDRLGWWQDRYALAQLCAEALADPRFLFPHARAAAAMLKKLAGLRASQSDRIERLVAAIREGAESSALHDWSAGYCRAPRTGDEISSPGRNGSAKSPAHHAAEGTNGKAFDPELDAIDV